MSAMPAAPFAHGRRRDIPVIGPRPLLCFILSKAFERERVRDGQFPMHPVFYT